MNFYNLIKQQYNNYKIEQTTIDNRCKKCPCRTIRDKILGEERIPNDCSDEMAYLVEKYKMYDINIAFCSDCRRVSVIIAKILFEKECINKI